MAGVTKVFLRSDCRSRNVGHAHYEHKLLTASAQGVLAREAADSSLLTKKRFPTGGIVRERISAFF